MQEEKFEVLLSKPLNASVSLKNASGWVEALNLVEPSLRDAADNIPSSNEAGSVPTFHGYAASGLIIDAEYVYANFGELEVGFVVESASVAVLRSHPAQLTPAS